MKMSFANRLTGIFALSVITCMSLLAAEAPATVTVTNQASDMMLRWSLEQQATRKAIEQLREEFREESAAAGRRNDHALTTRLHAVEQSLTAQRVRDLETLRNRNHETLLFAAGLGGISLLGMIVMGLFLYRATNQLSRVLAVLPGRALGAGSPTTVITGEVADASSARLFTLVDRLEKKLQQLEDVAQLRQISAPGEVAGPQNGAAAQPEQPISENLAHINALLGKGQSLLNLDKNEEALACFEEALALDSEHIETLIRRAKTLEKMRRLKDALETYDRALAIDNSLTIAYLGKGGVFNRMERFTEALECYEKALRTQQTSGIETVQA